MRHQATNSTNHKCVAPWVEVGADKPEHDRLDGRQEEEEGWGRVLRRHLGLLGIFLEAVKHDYD